MPDQGGRTGLFKTEQEKNRPAFNYKEYRLLPTRRSMLSKNASTLGQFYCEHVRARWNYSPAARHERDNRSEIT